jgi:hypothetical protein
VFVRNRWLTGQAIALHVGAFVIVAIMLGLGWWQIQRAIGGNTRSWAYAVQWPVLALYATYMWWKLLHDQPAFGGPKPPKAERGSDDPDVVGPVHIPAEEHPGNRGTRFEKRAEDEDRAMAEYNEYLAGLDAGDRQRGR